MFSSKILVQHCLQSESESYLWRDRKQESFVQLILFQSVFVLRYLALDRHDLSVNAFYLGNFLQFRFRFSFSPKTAAVYTL